MLHRNSQSCVSTGLSTTNATLTRLLRPACKCADVLRRRELELKMSDRKWLGDIGLAVLLALPTGALTRPQITGLGTHPTHATASAQTASAENSPLLQRFSLPG